MTSPAGIAAGQSAAGVSSAWHGAAGPVLDASGASALPLALTLGGVFTAVLLAFMLLMGWQREFDKSRRVSSWVDRYRHGHTAQDGENRMATSAMHLITRMLASSDAENKLATRLQLAGIRRKPAEWVLLGGCASLALAAVFTVVTHNVVVGVLIGAVAGWLGAHATLNTLISRRRAAFINQLPEVLELVAGSLQSGLTLTRSLDSVVRHGLEPAAGEFGRALAEQRLGADVEEALEGVANRMNSDDMRWTVMAIDIQRSVGGNLVQVLRNVVVTMRERGYLRRHVRALSAEGRMSAYILIALPILIGGWLFYSNADYMRPLYSSPIGFTMLGGSVTLLLAGSLWMRKLIRPEV